MITIYKYGRYINKVKDEHELRKWMILNLPPQDSTLDRYRPDTPDRVLKATAKALNLTFKNTNE